MDKLKCLCEYNENLNYIKVCKINLDDLLELKKNNSFCEFDYEIQKEIEMINHLTKSMNYVLKLIHSIHDVELQLILKKKFLENKSMYKIAEELNCSRITVYRKLYKALDVLGIKQDKVITNFSKGGRL